MRNLQRVSQVFIRPSSDGTYYGMVMSVCPSIRPSACPFSALFSYMLWHNELKFCTWLCFNVLQIKFECRHFASIFERVMPSNSLSVRPSGSPSVSHSFPHFSPSCFDVLSWNLAYHFLVMNSSSFVVVMPLLELKILEIHCFPQFSPTCFDILLWNFSLDFVLLYYWSSLSVVNFRQFL